MCGIAGVYIKDMNHDFDLNKLCDGLLAGIVQRGRDATGMCVIDDDGSDVIEKYAIPANEFIGHRDPIIGNPRAVLLHTRLTTQGSELVHENNHPVEYLDAVVTHNGVIQNDTEVFSELGCDRFAQVDTECIAASLHDISLDNEDQVERYAVRRYCNQ